MMPGQIGGAPSWATIALQRCCETMHFVWCIIWMRLWMDSLWDDDGAALHAYVPHAVWSASVMLEWNILSNNSSSFNFAHFGVYPGAICLNGISWTYRSGSMIWRAVCELLKNNFLAWILDVNLSTSASMGLSENASWECCVCCVMTIIHHPSWSPSPLINHNALFNPSAGVRHKGRCTFATWHRLIAYTSTLCSPHDGTCAFETT